MSDDRRRSSWPNEVVVGFDGTAEACDALALASLVAGAAGGELIVAAVYPGREHGESESRRDFFRRVFDRARYEADNAPFTRCEMVDSPARGLHTLADAEGASLLVVGSTHRGRFGQVLPGSLGNQLLSGAPCPVAVAPRGFSNEPELRTIGVGYEAGPESERALQFGIRLAERLHCRLRVITVGPRYGPLDLLFESAHAAQERLRTRLESGLAAIPANVSAEGALREGNAAAELTAASDELDLLIVGSRSYGPFRAALLGGTSADLIRRAASAVLVIPRGYELPLEDPDSMPEPAGRAA